MNKLVLGLSIALVVLLGFFAFNRENVVIKEVVKEDFGAFPGPDIYSDYFSINNVKEYHFSSGFNTATTTLCSYRAPNATTTLEFASVSFRTGTTTATVVDIGKSSLQNATTTTIVSYSLGANALASIVATSTPLEANLTNRVLAPLDYVTVLMDGGAGVTSLAPTGQCKFILREI